MKHSVIGMRQATSVVLCLAILTTISVVNVAPAAASTRIESVTLPAIETDIAEIVQIPQFDQAQGALRAVTVEMVSSISGSTELENVSDSSSSQGSVTLAAEILVASLDRPDLITLDPAVPAHTEPFDLAIFDGALDFAGSSGTTFSSMDGSDSVMTTFSDPSVIALFIGDGEVSFRVEATAVATATATNGNIELRFATQTSGQVNVTYQFEAHSISIEKTPDIQTIAQGEDAVFTIAVTNDGEADLTNVAVVDAAVPGCDLAIGDLAMGATFTYTCTAPGATEDFTNVAVVSGEDSIGNVVTDQDDAFVDVLAPQITVEKTPDSQTIPFNGTAGFTIEVTNSGDFDLSNVAVTDAQAPDCDASIGDLAVGQSASYDCATSDRTADFTNIAVATGQDDTGRVVTDEDEAFVDVIAPDILIEKTPDDQTVIVGRDVRFSIRVTNTGDNDLFDVTVTDPVTPGCERFIGDLPFGESVSYDCDLVQAVIEPFTNVATVVGEDGGGNVVTDLDDAIVRVREPTEPELPATGGSDASELSLAGLIMILLGGALVRYQRRWWPA